MIPLKHATDVTAVLSRWYGKAKMEQIERVNHLLKFFYATFGKRQCYICSSPGRVELVGNHTDHNGGKVLGCTIDRDILCIFAPSGNNKVVLASNNYRNVEFRLDQIDQKEANSRGMAKGVLKGLKDRHFNIGGVYMATHSNVPVGAGMSSSAAYQLLIGSVQNALFNDNKATPRQLAEIGQFAENTYFDKPCGLLDQSVIAVGGMVLMDFEQGLQYQQVNNNLQGLDFVVINTGGSHAKLTEHYAAIPKEMKQVAQLFGKERLCELDTQTVMSNQQQIVDKLGERPFNRAKHYFEENSRVLTACQAVTEGDNQLFANTIESSGNSSRYLLQNCSYQGCDGVLTSALDFVKSIIGQRGAVRVHGGGFAGTILCVVPHDNLKTFLNKCNAHFGTDNVFVVRLRSCGTDIM